jgi:hypothetical protein
MMLEYYTSFSPCGQLLVTLFPQALDASNIKGTLAVAHPDRHSSD